MTKNVKIFINNMYKNKIININKKIIIDMI